MSKNTSSAVAGCILAIFLSASSAMAQTTLAHWNFDAGAADTPFAARPVDDISGNGYLLHGYDPAVGPSYGTETPSRSGLSCHLNGQQDAYTVDPALNEWAPSQWTIEISVRLDQIEGWNTIIGRDGSKSPGGAKSDFYFQNNGTNDHFRLDFATMDGSRYEIETPYVATAGIWYHFALVSDGSAVSMYVDRGNGEGYELASSTPLTGANNALATSGANWTFGRGWYSGKHVDHIKGDLDDIRFTQGALPPTSFLHARPSALAMSRLEAARADREVSLTWNLPMTSLRQLNLYRHTSDDAAGRTLIATLYPPAKMYLDQVPESNATYWYWLVAVDSDGKNVTYGPTATKSAAVWTP